MTKLELITMMGDLIVSIDEIRASIATDDPRQATLLASRRDLDEKQRELGRQVFDENTAAFQEAAERLASINSEIQGTIDDIEKLETTIETVTRFVGAVTSVLTTVAGVI